MENGIYTIRDSVACEAGPIFTAKNDGIARRSYMHLIADQRVNCISDYTLYKLGTFNSETMEIKKEIMPIALEMEAVLDEK